MIKVSIYYPNEAGCSFDFDYYSNSHMPMVKERMAGACSHFTIDKGLAGGVPGAAPAYIAMGHLFFDSLDAFLSAYGPHAGPIAADIRNYTNVKPTVQISEVLVG
ncbi:EthD family reductase [Ralstonia chuxiongensis]|uniref:EthD family reductase n=1 Tax=Ralstonia chuxiongensis TaxID=2957504 RepID=UPI0028F56680|nr:EthD family reductase [Ralstonia chuxiongensis]CAJ0772883.1 hypothetical protein R8510_03069 [Ralstonia chuxiongensis]